MCFARGKCCDFTADSLICTDANEDVTVSEPVYHIETRIKMAGEKTKYLRSLVDRCLSGSEQAWDELVNIITPSIFGVCRSMNLARDESIEVFGQVCYLLLQNLKKLKSAERLLSFTSVTARREALRMKNRDRTLKRILNTQLLRTASGERRNPEEILEAEQRRDTLIAAVLSLSEKESKLMWSLFFDESSPKYQDISQRLGIPESSIGPTRARCLSKLRKILKRKGYDL